MKLRNGSPDDDPPFYIAGIYAIRGQREEALHWLKKAMDANWIDYAQVQHGPWFVKYRNDPDVIALLEVRSQENRSHAAKSRRNVT